MDNKDKAVFASDGRFGQEGLNKREYFAGLAMQSVTSDDVRTYWQIADILGVGQDEVREDKLCGLKARAKIAVQTADALLKALESEDISNE